MERRTGKHTHLSLPPSLPRLALTQSGHADDRGGPAPCVSLYREHHLYSQRITGYHFPQSTYRGHWRIECRYDLYYSVFVTAIDVTLLLPDILIAAAVSSMEIDNFRRCESSSGNTKISDDKYTHISCQLQCFDHPYDPS